MVRAALLVPATAFLFTGCAGSGGDYSAREQEAIDHAEQHLRTELATEAEGVSHVSSPSYEGDLWRVEVDTNKGYRCVYMYSDPEAYLQLLSVKSGEGCGGELLYNAEASNSLGDEGVPD